MSLLFLMLCAISVEPEASSAVVYDQIRSANAGIRSLCFEFRSTESYTSRNPALTGSCVARDYDFGNTFGRAVRRTFASCLKSNCLARSSG